MVVVALWRQCVTLLWRPYTLMVGSLALWVMYPGGTVEAVCDFPVEALHFNGI